MSRLAPRPVLDGKRMPSRVEQAASAIPKDFRLESYQYPLPESRIAQHPAERRDQSRLLVLDRASGRTSATSFDRLVEHLPKDALLVANNSRVLPARIFGKKPSGGRVEFLLLTPLGLISADRSGDRLRGEANGLLRASKGLKQGDRVLFTDSFSLTVLDRGDFGHCRVELAWQGDLESLFVKHGHMPLPPYIRRPDSEEDAARYQTIYARTDKTGSVAAPTAGLHFTDRVRADLAERGFGWAEVTLYVGYGTFSPVRCADIRQHRMHEEYVEVPAETAEAVARAKAAGRPVAAVGTTSVRALEGMFRSRGKISEFAGLTDLYLYPGSKFHVVDHLLTNFHLPESSLLIMISALAGRESVLAAYGRALKENFRFFSYGDAMLIV